MSLHLLCLLLLTFGLHVGRADEEDETVRANLLKDQLGAGGRVRALHHEADNNAAAAAAAGELHRITLDTWKDLHQSTPAPTMVPRLYGPFRRVLRSQLPFDREVSTIVPRDKDTRLVDLYPTEYVTSHCVCAIAFYNTHTHTQTLGKCNDNVNCWCVLP